MIRRSFLKTQIARWTVQVITHSRFTGRHLFPQYYMLLMLANIFHRCEWCGTTAHPACHKYITPECNFGVLEPIYLPPHCVSIPRTEVSVETILGVAKKPREAAATIRKFHTWFISTYDCFRVHVQVFYTGLGDRLKRFVYDDVIL